MLRYERKCNIKHSYHKREGIQDRGKTYGSYTQHFPGTNWKYYTSKIKKIDMNNKLKTSWTEVLYHGFKEATWRLVRRVESKNDWPISHMQLLKILRRISCLVYCWTGLCEPGNVRDWCVWLRGGAFPPLECLTCTAVPWGINQS